MIAQNNSQNLFSNTIVIKASMGPTSWRISILANWGCMKVNVYMLSSNSNIYLNFYRRERKK